MVKDDKFLFGQVLSLALKVTLRAQPWKILSKLNFEGNLQ